MPGPGKKPTPLKAISGTNQPCRAAETGVELPALTDIPAPPDWLPNAHAVKEWNRLAPILVANKLLTEAGLSSLGMLCSAHGMIVQLYTAGVAPTASQMAQLRNMANDFGLTPVAQGKVKPSGDEGKANKFAANKQRTA